jgi:urease accessory protein
METSITLHQLLRLQTWMSPAFPTGAYTCSHGMETVISNGQLADADCCLGWISNILANGSGWNDAVLLCQAWKICNDPAASTCDVAAQLTELNELALALQPGAERYQETVQLGASFLTAAQAWPESGSSPVCTLPGDLALPVVIGALAAVHVLPLDLTLATAVQAGASNLVWVATRLVPLGQSESVKMIAKLESTVSAVTSRAIHSTVDDLGSCALLTDLASLQHETLASRTCVT